jgi:hypothetical protein
MKWWDIIKIEPKDNPLSDEFEPPEIPKKLLMGFKSRIKKDLNPVLDKVTDGAGRPMLTLNFHDEDLRDVEFDSERLEFTFPIFNLQLDRNRLVRMMYLHNNRKRRTEITPFSKLLKSLESAFLRVGEYLGDITGLPINYSVQYIIDKFNNDVEMALKRVSLTINDVIARGEIKSKITGEQRLELFSELSPATFSVLERMLDEAGESLGGYLTKYDMPLEELVDEIKDAGRFAGMLADYYIESDVDGREYYEAWEEYEESFDLDQEVENKDLEERRLEESLRGRRNRG